MGFHTLEQNAEDEMYKFNMHPQREFHSAIPTAQRAHRSWKLAALYSLSIGFAFATVLSTAACSKFTPGGTLRGAEPNGTARGAAQTTREGYAGEVSASTVKVNSVRRFFAGTDDEPAWGLYAVVQHGGREMHMMVYPNTNPIQSDSIYEEKEDAVYIMQGICGDIYCAKAAVLIEAQKKNSTSRYQTVELWDFDKSTSTPEQRRETSNFAGVTSAFEQLTGQTVPDPYAGY